MVIGAVPRSWVGGRKNSVARYSKMARDRGQTLAFAYGARAYLCGSTDKGLGRSTDAKFVAIGTDQCWRIT